VDSSGPSGIVGVTDEEIVGTHGWIAIGAFTNDDEAAKVVSGARIFLNGPIHFSDRFSFSDRVALMLGQGSAARTLDVDERAFGFLVHRFSFRIGSVYVSASLRSPISAEQVEAFGEQIASMIAEALHALEADPR